MNTNTAVTAGLGLKPQHYEAASTCRAPSLWFEIHPENYMVAGGPRLAWLESIRTAHPLSLHGVALSLAAAAAPDEEHLRRLATLVRRFEPLLISEHLAWSQWSGAYRPDLLPVPRTKEALLQVAANVDRTQEVLQRRIAIENPSHYLAFESHDYGEVDFLAELARRTGCALLLDVNNVYVSANNLGYNAAEVVDSVPSDLVAEIHLAGHSTDAAVETLLIDSHDAPVAPAVWALYERLIERIGPRPTLVERDAEVPSFDELLRERAQAHAILQPLREAA